MALVSKHLHAQVCTLAKLFKRFSRKCDRLNRYEAIIVYLVWYVTKIWMTGNKKKWSKRNIGFLQHIGRCMRGGLRPLCFSCTASRAIQEAGKTNQQG